MSSWMWSQSWVGQGKDPSGVGIGGPVFPLTRHGAKSPTSCSMSLSKPGHHTRSLQRCFSLIMPRWPSCAMVSTHPLNLAGIMAQCPWAKHVSFQHDNSCFTRAYGWIRVSSKDTKAVRDACTNWTRSLPSATWQEAMGDDTEWDSKSATTLSLPEVYCIVKSYCWRRSVQRYICRSLWPDPEGDISALRAWWSVRRVNFWP